MIGLRLCYTNRDIAKCTTVTAGSFAAVSFDLRR
jgi:hypothetical protein